MQMRKQILPNKNQYSADFKLFWAHLISALQKPMHVELGAKAALFKK